MDLPRLAEQYVADRLARSRFRPRTAATVRSTLRGLCVFVPEGEPPTRQPTLQRWGVVVAS